MDVIRHDDERVNLHSRIVVWHFGPRRRDQGACCSQRYAVLHHLAKETDLPCRADSDEVCTGSGVVEFAKAKRRPAVMRVSDGFVGAALVAHAVILHRAAACGQAWEPAPTMGNGVLLSYVPDVAQLDGGQAWEPAPTPRIE